MTEYFDFGLPDLVHENHEWNQWHCILEGEGAFSHALGDLLDESMVVQIGP